MLRPTQEGRQTLALNSRMVANAVTELVQSAEAIKGKLFIALTSVLYIFMHAELYIMVHCYEELFLHRKVYLVHKFGLWLSLHFTHVRYYH